MTHRDTVMDFLQLAVTRERELGQLDAMGEGAAPGTAGAVDRAAAAAPQDARHPGLPTVFTSVAHWVGHSVVPTALKSASMFQAARFREVVLPCILAPVLLACATPPTDGRLDEQADPGSSADASQTQRPATVEVIHAAPTSASTVRRVWQETAAGFQERQALAKAMAAAKLIPPPLQPALATLLECDDPPPMMRGFGRGGGTQPSSQAPSQARRRRSTLPGSWKPFAAALDGLPALGVAVQPLAASAPEYRRLCALCVARMSKAWQSLREPAPHDGSTAATAALDGVVRRLLTTLSLCIPGSVAEEMLSIPGGAPATLAWLVPVLGWVARQPVLASAVLRRLSVSLLPPGLFVAAGERGAASARALWFPSASASTARSTASVQRHPGAARDVSRDVLSPPAAAVLAALLWNADRASDAQELVTTVFTGWALGWHSIPTDDAGGHPLLGFVAELAASVLVFDGGRRGDAVAVPAGVVRHIAHFGVCVEALAAVGHAGGVGHGGPAAERAQATEAAGWDHLKHLVRHEFFARPRWLPVTPTSWLTWALSLTASPMQPAASLPGSLSGAGVQPVSQPPSSQHSIPPQSSLSPSQALRQPPPQHRVSSILQPAATPSALMPYAVAPAALAHLGVRTSLRDALDAWCQFVRAVVARGASGSPPSPPPWFSAGLAHLCRHSAAGSVVPGSGAVMVLQVLGTAPTGTRADKAAVRSVLTLCTSTNVADAAVLPRTALPHADPWQWVAQDLFPAAAECAAAATSARVAADWAFACLVPPLARLAAAVGGDVQPAVVLSLVRACPTLALAVVDPDAGTTPLGGFAAAEDIQAARHVCMAITRRVSASFDVAAPASTASGSGVGARPLQALACRLAGADPPLLFCAAVAQAVVGAHSATPTLGFRWDAAAASVLSSLRELLGAAWTPTVSVWLFRMVRASKLSVDPGTGSAALCVQLCELLAASGHAKAPSVLTPAELADWHTMAAVRLTSVG